MLSTLNFAKYFGAIGEKAIKNAPGKSLSQKKIEKENKKQKNLGRYALFGKKIDALCIFF